MEETQIKETQMVIREISREDVEYPRKLKNYGGMPKVLFVKGTLPDPTKPVVAIVGARDCSAYGRIQAFRFAKVFSEAGVQVISGLAYGIDAEAHKGALEGGTPTFAVLGNGVDVCYPAGNRFLYQKIVQKQGGLISEYEPGVQARNYHFPIRNRIISALADVILVIEAKERSGSLITARYALDQGKTVYALPGIVTEERSIGCHKLIFDGAGIAYSPEIVLAECGILAEKGEKQGKKQQKKENFSLESDLKLVYSCLDLRPKTPDEFLTETGLPAEKVRQALMELELLGYAREMFRHHYIRNE